MSQEQDKANFRRLMEEGFAKGNLAVFDELLAPNLIEHQSTVRPPSPEGVKALVRQLHEAYPDFRCEVQDLAAERDTVWARTRGGGTQRGMLFGFAPSGKSVTIVILDVCRFENGKIVEHWGVPDIFGMMMQVGAIPQPVREG